MAKIIKTRKQATAIKIMLEEGGSVGNAMRKAGYAPATAKNPSHLTNSQAWKQAIKEIDYAKQIRQVEQMADINLNEDKDNVLKSKDMLFRLGDIYPATKSKIIGLFDKIGDVLEDENKE